MGRKNRSASCRQKDKEFANKRHRSRPNNPSQSNHANRSAHRQAKLAKIRDELTAALGLPPNFRFYFLKKHDLNNLPNKKPLTIKFGNSVIVDRDSLKVIQINQFNPFSTMTKQRREEFALMIKGMYRFALRRAPVKTNGSTSGLLNWGDMRAVGFRPGTDKGRAFGCYAFNQSAGCKEDVILVDEQEMLGISKIHDLLAETMSSLSLKAFQSNHDIALRTSVPSFADKDWSQTPNANVFASNLVVTRDGFFNKPHQDNDATQYVMGLFGRINRDTGDLFCIEESDYLGDIVGVNFWQDQYHCRTNFDGCDGIVVSIWTSNEIHHTSPSTTYDEGWSVIEPKTSPITRFGCSLQINSALVHRIQGVLKLKLGKTDEEWEVFKEQVVKSYGQEVAFKKEKIHDAVGRYKTQSQIRKVPLKA